MDWFGTVGLEAAVVLPFTLDLARLSPKSSSSKSSIRGLHVRAVLVGENFHFGTTRPKRSSAPRIWARATALPSK